MSKYNSGCPVKFIDNALIICQDHPNVALTSNLAYGELSSEANKLITVATCTQYSKINFDIVLSHLQDNNRYNIFIYSFRYNIKIVVTRM